MKTGIPFIAILVLLAGQPAYSEDRGTFDEALPRFTDSHDSRKEIQKAVGFAELVGGGTKAIHSAVWYERPGTVLQRGSLQATLDELRATDPALYAAYLERGEAARAVDRARRELVGYRVDAEFFNAEVDLRHMAELENSGSRLRQVQNAAVPADELISTRYKDLLDHMRAGTLSAEEAAIVGKAKRLVLRHRIPLLFALAVAADGFSRMTLAGLLSRDPGSFPIVTAPIAVAKGAFRRQPAQPEAQEGEEAGHRALPNGSAE